MVAKNANDRVQLTASSRHWKVFSTQLGFWAKMLHAVFETSHLCNFKHCQEGMLWLAVDSMCAVAYLINKRTVVRILIFNTSIFFLDWYFDLWPVNLKVQFWIRNLVFVALWSKCSFFFLLILGKDSQCIPFLQVGSDTHTLPWLWMPRCPGGFKQNGKVFLLRW